jgi:nucleoside-diphosphate-sugar epimerase
MIGKIVVTGAAGLVGQNLIPRLKQKGLAKIVAIDKHPMNTAVLRRLHPDIEVLEEDLAVRGKWEERLAGASAIVMAHAQIGGIDPAEFVRNNVSATERLLETALRSEIPYMVNISSSVVNSMAIDNYTETKKQQEALVAASGIKQVILRPTLMFGWFDRKHIGWLARFMKRVPIFPIPGAGRYLRQPLYVGDFCDIISSAIEGQTVGAYNITGLERIDYIDLIYALKEATGAKAYIFRIPYPFFATLLRINSVFDRDPPFTVKQLEALATPDIFEVIDWPGIFRVRATPLRKALIETFQNPTYSHIPLQF